MAANEPLDEFAHDALTDLTLMLIRAQRLRRAAAKGPVEPERLAADLAELERLSLRVASRITAFVRDQDSLPPP